MLPFAQILHIVASPGKVLCPSDMEGVSGSRPGGPTNYSASFTVSCSPVSTLEQS